MYFCRYFSGVHNDETKNLYEKAEQRVTFGTKIAGAGLFVAPLMSWSPIILVAYHWYMGKYTIHSWVFFHPVW